MRNAPTRPKENSCNFPKDPNDDDQTYTVRKTNKQTNKQTNKREKCTLSFPSLLTANERKATSTFLHCRTPQFAFSNCKPKHHQENFHLSEYRYVTKTRFFHSQFY